MDNQILIRELLDKYWDDPMGTLQGFYESAYHQSLLDAYSHLRTEVLYQSHMHGQGHIERVMLFGAVLGWKLRLSDEELLALLFCCSYHDIGRINDHRDTFHGTRSANLIIEHDLLRLYSEINFGKKSVIFAAISAHSVPGCEQDATALQWGVQDSRMDEFRRLTALLKDSDGLDRVRMHGPDPARLRHSEARKLIEFAENLYLAYANCERREREN